MKTNSASGQTDHIYRAGLIIGLGAIASYLGSALPLFRDALQNYYAIDLTQLGMLFSIGLIPAAATILLAGFMLDGRSPLPLLRIGVIGAAVGMALAALSQRFGVMLLAVVAVTSFTSLLALVVPAYLVRLFPNHQRRALSLQLAVGGFVGMVCPLLAEGLLHLSRTRPSVSFGLVLHAPCALLAAILLGGAFWLWRMNGAPPLTHEAAADGLSVSGRGLRFGGLSGRAIGLIMLLTLHCMSDNALAMWLPRVMDSASFAVRGLPPGVVLAGAALAYLVYRALLGFAPEHRGSRLGMVVPGPLGGGLVLLGLLSRSAVALGVCYMIGALLWSCEYPVLLARGAKEEPRRFATIMALGSVGSSLGTFLLGTSMGWVGEWLGESRMWLVLLVPACGFVLVGVGSVLWLARFGRAQPRQ